MEDDKRKNCMRDAELTKLSERKQMVDIGDDGIWW